MITIKNSNVSNCSYGIGHTYDYSIINYSKHISFLSIFDDNLISNSGLYGLEYSGSSDHEEITGWLLNDNSYKNYAQFRTIAAYWKRYNNYNTLSYNTTFLQHVRNGTIIGGYSVVTYLSGKINVHCLLCVKPEYIYYVKLCILTKTPVEFDCFYLLVDKNEYTDTNSYDKSIFIKAQLTASKIVREVSKYDIEVIYTDMNKSIFRSITIPKTGTIAQYNNWLDDIKLKYKSKNITDINKESLLVEL